MAQALEPREEKILDYIVRLYVRKAEPVASSDVRRGLRLKESPATVRNILAALDEGGYLDQPYTSAGRIPTDQAYRYFVDYLMSNDFRRIAAAEDSANTLHSMADALRMLAIVAEGDDTDSYGLSHLLSQPEFRVQGAVQRIAHLIDRAGDIFGAYRESGERRVFIGRENPVREAADCSVFYMERNEGGAHREMLLVGPTRVNYERISAFINKFFNDYE